MDVEVQQALAGLLGPEHVVAGEAAASFAVDGLYPTLAVSPGTPEEVAAALALAERGGLGVIPWGGGTGQGLGNLPRRYDLALSLGRLDRVLDHQPADLTVTVEAGITLDRLQERLGEHGQFLPLDPPCSDRATIGGILACAAAGPRRLRYGGPRDFLLGVRVAHPDGILSRAGGKVVKNVAGFDLNRLYTGSFGTLGVIVEATFKVLPRPASFGMALATFAAMEAASRFVPSIMGTAARPLALDLVNPAGLRLLAAQSNLDLSEEGYGVVVEFGGVEAAVKRQQQEFGALATAGSGQCCYVKAKDEADRLQRALSDLGWTLPVPAALVLRASGLPSTVPAVVEAWEEAGQRLGVEPIIRAHAANGMVEGFWSPAHGSALAPATAIDLVRTLTQHAARLAANLVVAACAPEVKAQVDVWGPAPESFPLMQRIKAEFDPHGTLNSGRFLGRL